MNHEKLIARINELARKSKVEPLSTEEKAEQQELRQQYIAMFRGNLKAQLDSIVVVDEKGNKTKLKEKHHNQNKVLH